MHNVCNLFYIFEYIIVSHGNLHFDNSSPAIVLPVVNCFGDVPYAAAGSVTARN